MVIKIISEDGLGGSSESLKNLESLEVTWIAQYF